MSDEPVEEGRYVAAIAWWPHDVLATFRGGVFIPDGYEDDTDRHFPPRLVTVIAKAPR